MPHLAEGDVCCRDALTTPRPHIGYAEVCHPAVRWYADHQPWWHRVMSGEYRQDAA